MSDQVLIYDDHAIKIYFYANRPGYQFFLQVGMVGHWINEAEARQLRSAMEFLVSEIDDELAEEAAIHG